MTENTADTYRTERVRTNCIGRFLSWCNCQSIMVAFKGIWTKDFWRAVSGEYLATLIFVLLGLGSTINWLQGRRSLPRLT
ncbi:Aquaporin-4 [Dissostichus eleginoides]|uniref:Aquaporin-4 n=1 Tax=Dissostichus eleginoides TaxID=100907 RepID=A0AAD9B8R3_DISEL|nr:Aquaporin-4 [Dissostichus eleginoides]